MGRRILQWVAAYFWGYVFAMCSALMAGFHAYQTATGQYAWVSALQLALASIGGSLGLGWASYIRKKFGFWMAVPTVIGALMAVFVTLWGGLGLFTTKADTASAERKSVATKISLDRDKLKRLKTEHEGLKARSAGVVSADLANIRARPQYKASDGCDAERITAAATREVCERYRNLEGELSTAKEIERLEKGISEIEARLRDAPPEVKPDQQAEAFSTLTGGRVSIEMSQALFALCASIALELIAAGAMVRAQARMAEWYELEIARALKRADVPESGSAAAKEKAAKAERTALERAAPRHELRAPEPVAEPKKPAPRKVVTLPSPANAGSVAEFLKNVVKRDPTERLALRAAYREYKLWCQTVPAPAAAVDKFCQDLEKALEDLGGTIEHDGQSAYCVGIRLADAA